MRILAVETSCDETAAAVVDASGKREMHFSVLSNIVSSQIPIHRKYGGVVPTLAAREHVKHITPVVSAALREAGASFQSVDLLCVTTGPGLKPSLLIGVTFTRMLAYGSGKPIIGVNHLEGHIYANFLHNKAIAFPVLVLVVSGGHTQLIFMRTHGKYSLLGETRDDAAGEAFDKIAKILNLSYPGGPEIELHAEKGNARAFAFPRPMLASKDFEFSFSGLKTAVLYETRKHNRRTNRLVMDICASAQQAIVDVLVKKTLRAMRVLQPKTVFLTGGVAANALLRETLALQVAEGLRPAAFFAPPFKMSTDNAAMIAAAGYARHLFSRTRIFSWSRVLADANARLEMSR